MNDFVQRYKNQMGGMSKKKQSKGDKKGLTNALHTSFKLAQDGQIGILVHLGAKFITIREDKLQELVQNRGQINLTKEQKEFQTLYNILLGMMQPDVLDTSNEKDAELFGEIDAFTFEFSRTINGMKKDRKEVMDKFMKLINGNVKLKKIFAEIKEKLIAQQQQQMAQQEQQRVNQQTPQQVQNHGKLT